MKSNILEINPTVTRTPVTIGAVKKSYTYENNTGVPIYITDSTGAYIIVEPKRNVISPNAIVIYVTYRTPPGSVNMIGISDGLPQAVYRSLCTELDRVGESTLMYVIEDPIPVLRGEAVVLERLGLTFSKRPVELDRTPVRSNHQGSHLTLGVVIVQSHREEKPIRWVRYYNVLIEVTPVKAQYYDDGAYLVVLNGDTVNGGRLMHFEFDDPLSPMRCFTTEEEARKYDWAKNAIPCLNEAKEKLERQFNINEQNIAARKAEMELEHKRRLNELTIEREENLAVFREFENEMKRRSEERKDELEERSASRKDNYDERSTVRKDTYDERSTVRKDTSEDRKDRYEDRSHSRKDASETLKIIPAFITAGIAIIAMLM